MTLNDIASVANSYTDESISTTIIKGFVNSAISKINTNIKSILPTIHDTEAYTALSDDWINSVIVPYVCWSIKMNDSSLNEANSYLYQYEVGMKELKKNKHEAISTDYQGSSFKTVYTMTRYNRM